jgi:hypothetical protein
MAEHPELLAPFGLNTRYQALTAAAAARKCRNSRRRLRGATWPIIAPANIKERFVALCDD